MPTSIGVGSLAAATAGVAVGGQTLQGQTPAALVVNV
jgi:hypothetical protein